MKVRDAQKNRLYEAEQSVRRWLDYGGYAATRTENTVSDREPKFSTIAETQAFVDQVWMAEGFPGLPPRVVKRRDGAATTSYFRAGNEIHTPDWGRRAMVQLHEISHAVIDHPLLPAHGPNFVEIFVGLVRRHLGEDVADQLLTACDARKVLVGRDWKRQRKYLREIVNGHHDNASWYGVVVLVRQDNVWIELHGRVEAMTDDGETFVMRDHRILKGEPFAVRTRDVWHVSIGR